MADPIVIPANSLWEVRMNGFVDAQQCITTWHYLNQVEVANLADTLDELLVEFETQNWVNRIRGALSVGYENMFLDAQCIRPIRYRSHRRIPANRAGTIAGDCSPSGVSIVVRRTTPRSGRKFQGRIYLPGIAESTTVQSSVTTGWFVANAANLQDAVTENLTLPVAGEFVSVVYHPGAVTLADEITLGKVDISIRYQRRREIGVGI